MARLLHTPAFRNGLLRLGRVARESAEGHQEANEFHIQPQLLLNNPSSHCYASHSSLPAQAACFSSFSLASLSHAHHRLRVPQLWTQVRRKSKKSSRSSAGDEDSGSESENEDDEQSTDFKVLKGRLDSTRIDAVLKFSLGMSRNKVENAFYSDSIYLNGERLDKKRHSVDIEDEVDVVRGANALNPAFIDVQRVEVLDIQPSSKDPNKLDIKVRRFKKLTIENYTRPWKAPASD